MSKGEGENDYGQSNESGLGDFHQAVPHGQDRGNGLVRSPPMHYYSEDAGMEKIEPCTKEDPQ